MFIRVTGLASTRSSFLGQLDNILNTTPAPAKVLWAALLGGNLHGLVETHKLDALQNLLFRKEWRDPNEASNHNSHGW